MTPTTLFYESKQKKVHIFHAADGLAYFCIVLETRMSILKQALPLVIPHWILPNYLFLKTPHSHKQDIANGISRKHLISFHFIPWSKMHKKAFTGTVFSNKYQNRHQRTATPW